eukprot:m.74055 g.74055  ORF g.74055 m.74055 type:complete len:416 (+) comp7752_c1_seq4:102-1349(+)
MNNIYTDNGQDHKKRRSEKSKYVDWSEERELNFDVACHNPDSKGLFVLIVAIVNKYQRIRGARNLAANEAQPDKICTTGRNFEGRRANNDEIGAVRVQVECALLGVRICVRHALADCAAHGNRYFERLRGLGRLRDDGHGPRVQQLGLVDIDESHEDRVLGTVGRPCRHDELVLDPGNERKRVSGENREHARARREGLDGARRRCARGIDARARGLAQQRRQRDGLCRVDIHLPDLCGDGQVGIRVDGQIEDSDLARLAARKAEHDVLEAGIVGPTLADGFGVAARNPDSSLVRGRGQAEGALGVLALRVPDAEHLVDAVGERLDLDEQHGGERAAGVADVDRDRARLCERLAGRQVENRAGIRAEGGLLDKTGPLIATRPSPRRAAGPEALVAKWNRDLLLAPHKDGKTIALAL